ncbi:hypothetical protein SBF1_9440002 [Candidatus Desulfosporosinus infrequens]|uniref:Uncharacterized protein n=1 Tax=Candidatus Desulfosporosinus infrequens TaxID=2043169 RepID=A0A2U3LXL3_9FIRM|nr:hypothetical protein SBF1_9440002 [Candidatus Desulfosporosinus infrequens]
MYLAHLFRVHYGRRTFEILILHIEDRGLTYLVINNMSMFTLL